MTSLYDLPLVATPMICKTASNSTRSLLILRGIREALHVPMEAQNEQPLSTRIECWFHRLPDKSIIIVKLTDSRRGHSGASSSAGQLQNLLSPVEMLPAEKFIEFFTAFISL